MLEDRLQAAGTVVMRGDEFVRWDLRVRGGLIGGVHVRQLTEDLKEGAQLVRLYARPTCSRRGAITITFCSMVSIGFALENMPIAAALTAMVVMLLAAILLRECGAAMATLIRTAKSTEEK
jgi:hypothetical protein